MLRVASLFFVLIVLVPALVAAAPLFPIPLHITRQVYDPISETTTVVNEYGYGNRMVAIRGGKTSIADYEKGELIEIDREAGTYSITRFDEVAKATQRISPRSAAAPPAGDSARRRTPFRTIGARLTPAGRSAEFFEGDVEEDAVKQKIQVGLDRKVMVSREALEVLLGAAYPGVQTREHELVLSAAASNQRAVATDAAGSREAEASYALPVEHVTRYELDGRQLEFRSSVTRLGNEPPPADLIAIPAGARLIVSRVVAVQRELDQQDRPLTTPPRTP